MARGPASFRQSDATAAVKGVIKGGIPVERVRRVEIDKNGKIVVVCGEPKDDPTSEGNPSTTSWDEAVADLKQRQQAMTHIRLAYVQSFINKKTGGVFHYFRRPGAKRVRLPGLPGSPEFMRAYEAALDTPAPEIGAKRTKSGSVNAAIATYYSSLQFRSLAAGTQAMRRGILERFRADHGDRPIALMPQKFIALTLSTMKPHAARNWLKALRSLLQFAISQEMRTDDPTQGIKLPRVKTDGYYTWDEDDIATFEAFQPSAPRRDLPSWFSYSRRSDAATSFGWGASTSAMGCFPYARIRPASRSQSPCTVSCARSWMRRRASTSLS
jgi:hypothetical protein